MNKARIEELARQIAIKPSSLNASVERALLACALETVEECAKVAEAEDEAWTVSVSAAIRKLKEGLE